MTGIMKGDKLFHNCLSQQHFLIMVKDYALFRHFIFKTPVPNLSSKL